MINFEFIKDINIYKGENKLYIVLIKKSKGKINGKLNIGILLQLVKKLKIFDSDLEKGLEDIQKIRNDLHIQKILENDVYKNKLTDKKMLKLFKFTKNIQSIIIKKISSLNN